MRQIDSGRMRSQRKGARNEAGTKRMGGIDCLLNERRVQQCCEGVCCTWNSGVVW